MKTIIAFFFSIFLLTPSWSMDLQKMKVIQTMMDSAKTQADLNFASSMLFDAWKLEVEKKESQVSQMIPKNLRLKFKRTMKLWKNHVEQMSSIRSELFRLDMIEPKYYKIRGLESKVSAAKKAKNMQPYIYNMSRSIYYEEKWIELDVLLNAK